MEVSFVCIGFSVEEICFAVLALSFLVGSVVLFVLADVGMPVFAVVVGTVFSSSGRVVTGGSSSRSSPSLCISEWAVLLYQSSKSGSVSVACILAEVSSSFGSEFFLFLDSISCFSCFSRRSVLLILAKSSEKLS